MRGPGLNPRLYSTGLKFRSHAFPSKGKNRKISADDADDADEILILRGSLMFHGPL
jgi:hypothetical protein